jgi:hypothetical protein
MCPVRLLLVHACTRANDRATIDRRLARTLAAERSAVAGLDATLLDLEASFCDASRCHTDRGGVLLYRDREHLSVAGAERLEPIFARLIARTTHPRAQGTPVS